MEPLRTQTVGEELFYIYQKTIAFILKWGWEEGQTTMPNVMIFFFFYKNEYEIYQENNKKLMAQLQSVFIG